jgi:hypothetical protein
MLFQGTCYCPISAGAIFLNVVDGISAGGKHFKRRVKSLPTFETG